MKMLWTGEYDEHYDKKFSEILEVEKKGVALTGDIPNSKMNEEELIEALQGVDVYLSGYDDVTARVLKNAPDLKLILSVRDGPEGNIDLKAAEELGIPVCGAGGRCCESVAEFTLELMLLLARKTISLTNRMRAEGLHADNRASLRAITVTGTELMDKTLGIVGLGRNGRRLAQLGRAFNMKVIAYDPFVTKEAMADLGVEKAELNVLMQSSDYISILARLNPQTERMVGREQINMMKKTAYLVNTGRAMLVDNEALWDALLEDRIQGAAVDVYEPDIEFKITGKERFYQIPPEKLIMTPHTAGATMERPHHQSRNLYEQFIGYLRGEKPFALVTRGVFETPEFESRGKLLWNIKS